MKYIYTLMIAVLLFNTVQAQEGFRKLGIGAELALPMGTFGDVYATGFGASAKVFYGLNADADLTATLGYIHFGVKSDTFVSGHVGMIPLQFGYRHTFGGFYAEPQVGVAFLQSKVNVKGVAGLFDGASGTNSATKFSVGLGGGYEFGDWDLGLRYQLVDQTNFLALRVGYNFSL
ncbi:outer membrane beta-barrel protein [Myroides fluvii]|uniref:outer membrane beta-barrel protein n=1 Tax=Myroides fluvii TaxID=2572594 RepID=UPI00131E8BA6|nr:hypothetical protein [Myroides fluvii]